jgi:hypothetical protein
MRKPPIWEKLSRPGSKPSTKDIITSRAIQARSTHGRVRSFQVYRRSRSVKAMMPKSEPDAPVDAIPVAAKLPPMTKPKIPLLT